jgi:hypothetical protein
MSKRSRHPHSTQSSVPSSKRIRHDEYEGNFAAILTSEQERAIYEKICTELSTLDEKLCVVCSALSSAYQLFSTQKLKNTTLLQAMMERLSPFCDLPVQITNYYDISHYHDMFKGMLLSKRGIYNGHIAICKQCLISLRNKKIRFPPKFAIANGF